MILTYNVQEYLTSWVDKKSCTKQRLLPLVGCLHHAESVFNAGCTFLHHLINLSTSVSKFHHHIHLFNSAQSDILQWNSVQVAWNGISLFLTFNHRLSVNLTHPGHRASQQYGATISSKFNGRIPGKWQPVNIAAKELLAFYPGSSSSIGICIVRQNHPLLVQQCSSCSNDQHRIV